MTISFNDIAAGALAFHNQHNALHPESPLDVVDSSSIKVYRQIQLHDYLHYCLQLTVADEDLLACIEARLDGGCTHLSYLSEYTDRLPAGFIELWSSCMSS
jgi:hypothetical protein